MKPTTRMPMTAGSVWLGALMCHKVVCCFGLAMGALVAHAGEQSGTVSMHHTTYGATATSPGLAFFVLQGGGAKANRPACNTFIDRWVISNGHPGAKFQQTVLLAAVTSGKTVNVIGTGQCDLWGDSETVMDIRINN